MIYYFFLSIPNNTRSNGYKLFYPSSSNPSTPNCRNLLSYRHLKIWNDLDASVVKSTPLCKFNTLLSDIYVSPYLYYNRNIPSCR